MWGKEWCAEGEKMLSGHDAIFLGLAVGRAKVDSRRDCRYYRKCRIANQILIPPALFIKQLTKILTAAK